MTLEYFEVVDDVAVEITPSVQLVVNKGERFKGVVDGDGTLLRISLNSSDFAGMKIEGRTFLVVKIPNEKVKVVPTTLGFLEFLNN